MNVHRLPSPSQGNDPAGIGSTQVLNALPVGVFITDPDGALTFYNDAAATLWGQRPSLGEQRWCGAWKLAYRDGRPMSAEDGPVARALRDGREVPGQHAMAVRPDGTMRLFSSHPVLLRGPDGQVTGSVCTIAEVLTDENETRLAAVVESTTDAVISKDLNGIISSWNKAAESLFGHTAEEAVGRHITMVIPEDRLDEETQIISRIRAGLRVETYETIRKRKDGSLVAVELTVSPMRDSTGRIFGASKIARDVSVRKETEHRIRLLMREVNHRVKNQYAVILSMIRETGRRIRDPREFERQVRERIMALSASHDLLVSDDWRGTTIFELALAQLRPFGADGRFTISGPSLKLRPSAVQYLGIALHELAANSAVYGVLSTSTGKIAVEWSVLEATQDRPETLRLTWTETGGPEPQSGAGAGFGTVVLERITPQAMAGTGELGLGAAGVSWTLEAPLDQVTAELGRNGFTVAD